MQWCGCIEENCDTCLKYSVPFCPPTNILVTTTNLTDPNLDYFVWIKDKFGNIFTDQVPTNNNGNFFIRTNNFPVGMFAPNFGDLDLYINSDNGSGQILQPIIINNIPYNCLIFSINKPIYLTDDSGCILLTDDNGNPLIAQ